MERIWSIIQFWAAHFVFGFGFILLIIGALLVFARRGRDLSAQQNNVVRVMYAVGAACMLSEVPGLLNLDVGGWLTAAGALAVFAVVFYWWR